MYPANDSRIIVALDFPDARSALRCARGLDPSQCRVKVGKELFTAGGPAVVEELVIMGFDVFLDLKFHDIPNTVAGAVKAAANLGVWMMNVHAFGGQKMLEAATSAVANLRNRPLVVGVTVLTSMDDAELEKVGVFKPVADQVRLLADLSQQSGLDGVVASPQETKMIRHECREGFLAVTPGIRLPDGNVNDQKRVATPEYAMKNGADYLVVGRPITEAAIPGIALQNFNDRVRNTLGN